MKAARTHLLRATAAVSLPLLTAGMLPAQTTNSLTLDPDSPIVIETRREKQGFYFAPVDMSLEATATYLQTRNDSGGVKSDSKQWVFTQQLNAATRGFYLHPNFIEFYIDFGAGVEESFLNTDGQTESQTGPLYRWDVSATLLRNGEWPFTVFSRREETHFSSAYGWWR